MRGNPAAHELIAPGSLSAVLDLLAAEPGKWTPIAGGTELMVAFSAGRLIAPKLVSLWGIRDLRGIEVAPRSIVIGAAATFLDLRRNAVIATDLPLLAKAASWIGSIANQVARHSRRKPRERLAGGRLLARVVGLRRRD